MTRELDAELRSFKSDLKRNYLFLSTEARIRNPASPRSRPRSETLLSAYTVLSCGRFENFLKQSFSLAASDLKLRIVNSRDPRIPEADKFHWNNINGFIEWSSRAKNITRSEMSIKIEEFAASISQGHIYPPSFQNTEANPKSEIVKKMFNKFGVDDPIQKISDRYLDSLGRSLTKTTIESKLDTFVNRRHEAAHHGRIPSVTRVDIGDDHIFMNALAEGIKRTLADHVGAIA